MPLAYILLGITILTLAVIARSRYLKYTNHKSWLTRHGAQLENSLSQVRAVLQSFDRFTDSVSGYFNHFKLTQWMTEAELAVSTLKKLPAVDAHVRHGEAESINVLIQLIKDAGDRRKEFNRRFVEEELRNRATYFNTLLRNPPDPDQRRAIVVDEDCNLIVAGAGCGKTTTIEGKVKYIIDRYKVTETEILLLSFTRKSADELSERINDGRSEKIAATTFHALGLKIIGLATGEKPTVVEAHLANALVNNAFRECRRNPPYLLDVLKFFTRYLRLPPESSADSPAEDRNALKVAGIAPLKSISQQWNGRVTMKKDLCKSMEEVEIANLLFVCGVRYEYERDYEHRTATADRRQYQPDFYLPEHGVYIEHFGVDRDGNAPRRWGNDAAGTFSQQKYDEVNARYKEKMRWADELHATNGTQLIKTYSWEKHDNADFGLKEKLQQVGINLEPLPPATVWAMISQDSEKDVSAFEKLLSTFLTLFKSGGNDLPALRKQAKAIKDIFERKRATLFLDLFEPMLNEYEQSLKRNNRIDFNDMINKATGHVKSGRYTQPLRYIIVDEFQDLSFDRYHLLRALQLTNPGCKMFCVGDDWQSIYRFAGSDITLFTEFDKHFGVTETNYIRRTYRFNQELIDVTSSFIQANPKQLKKSIQSGSTYSAGAIEILYGRERDLQLVRNALDAILKEAHQERLDIQKVKILFLGRFNHDCDFFNRSYGEFQIHRHTTNGEAEQTRILSGPHPELNMEFMTMHRSKGLEADYVILLNCISGKYGIPSQQADDPILNLLLSDADQFEHGEERRLFYVALTRTKRKVFVLTSQGSESPFVTELRK